MAVEELERSLVRYRDCRAASFMYLEEGPLICIDPTGRSQRFRQNQVSYLNPEAGILLIMDPAGVVDRSDIGDGYYGMRFYHGYHIDLPRPLADPILIEGPRAGTLLASLDSLCIPSEEFIEELGISS